MKLNNKITTLIPTYNRASFLKKTIESVENQKFPSIQVNVFDDCSEDDTESEIQKLSERNNRINYRRNPNNIGYLKNFKQCFASVDTEYFSVMGDDDLLHPDFYKAGIDFLEENKDIDFVIFKTLPINNKGEIIESFEDFEEQFHIFNTTKGFNLWIQGKLPVYWMGMIFREKCRNLYLDMDQNDLDAGHDMRFLLRLFSRHKFAITGKVGAYYRYHDGNLSTKVISQYNIVSQIMRLQRFVEVLEDKYVSCEVKNMALLKLSSFEFPNFKYYAFNKIKNDLTLIESFGYEKYEMMNMEKNIAIPKFYLELVFNKLLKFHYLRRIILRSFAIVKKYKKARHFNSLIALNQKYHNELEIIKKYL